MKNQKMVELGKKGGAAGGPARARVLSSAQKSAIAKLGGNAKSRLYGTQAKKGTSVASKGKFKKGDKYGKKSFKDSSLTRRLRGKSK